MKPRTTDSPLNQWFRSANCDGRYGASLLFIIAVMATLCLGGPTLRMALQYDRAGLAAGQWWRLLTAHLVHLGAEHAALNVAGLTLLWCLFARAFRPSQWIAIVLLGALVIDAGLWFFSPLVQWYVGTSGVLHAVWGAGACAVLAKREPLGVPLICLLVVKLGYEQTHSASVIAASLPVVVDAHLYGALAGLVGARAVASRALITRRESL